MELSTKESTFKDEHPEQRIEGNETNSEASSSEEAEESDRLAALIRRREKARQEQQYINAQSFLKKSAATHEESATHERNHEDEQLNLYAQQAEQFLEKAFSEDKSGDVLVLGGSNSSPDNSSGGENGNESFDSDEVLFENTTDSSSVADDRRNLERYSQQFEEFLTLEPDEDEILMNSGILSTSEVSSHTQDEIQGLRDIHRALSLSQDSLNSDRMDDCEGNATKNLEDKSRFSHGDSGPDFPSGQKSSEESVSRDDTVEKLQDENENLFNMLVECMATMDTICSEVEETLDAMARDNARLKSISEIYRSQAEENRHKFETARNCESCNHSDSVELELDSTKIQLDEAKLRCSTLEEKLKSKKGKQSSREKRYLSEIEALKQNLTRISKENERERQTSKELRQKISDYSKLTAD